MPIMLCVFEHSLTVYCVDIYIRSLYIGEICNVSNIKRVALFFNVWHFVNISCHSKYTVHDATTLTAHYRTQISLQLCSKILNLILIDVSNYLKCYVTINY